MFKNDGFKFIAAVVAISFTVAFALNLEEIFPGPKYEPHVVEEILPSQFDAYVSEKKESAESIVRKFVKNKKMRDHIIDVILAESWEQDIDPILVTAIIAQESSFNPKSRSYCGARGLMQVMPFWKKEIGSKRDNLYDIKTNVRYGTKILSYYLDKHSDDLPKALSAYNGSFGSKRYYLKVVSHLDDPKGLHAEG